MPEEQKEFVRAMLVKAGFPSQDIEWMVDSCPSIYRAREICDEVRRNGHHPATRARQ